MKTKVAPNKYETQSLGSSEAESQSSKDDKAELKTSIFSSIKFLLIILISLLIMISVIFLSVIWISSFSSAVGEMSTKVRTQDFDKIVSFTKKILNDVMLVTESVKSQLYNDFDFNTMIEKHMFKAMKVAQKYLPSVTQGVNIGDPFGAFYGLAHLGEEITYYNLTPGYNQLYYNCRNFYSTDYCNRTSEPDTVYPPFTSNFVAESASVNPGNPVFTLSYVDPTLPNIVFLTAVSSLKLGNIKPGANFSYFFGYDMTVASISEFLVEITKAVHGSTSFIIEKKTDFIIASDHPDVAVAVVDSQGSVLRKTANDFGGEVTKIGNIVYGAFKTFDELTCNTESVLSDASNVISVYRLCTDEGLEWVLVFSVPQWNYIGSMVIAIICAIFGSIIIVSIGVVMAVLFSLKIVRPFTNLIQAFEMVSNMELEDLHLYKTIFSEVKILQFHFNSMIDRIKLYRKFIPPHLLVQLDSNNQQEHQENEKESTIEASETQSKYSKYSKSHRGELEEHSSTNHSNKYHSSRANRMTPVNMFSLYLDKRKVTFVNTCLEGLNEWFLKMTPNDTVTVLSDIFDIIGQCAKTSNGQIGKFENEMITIHFNATNDQNQHEMKGLQLCNIMLSKLNAYKETKLRKHQLMEKYKDSYLIDQFNFRIVANSQLNLCGNLGTKQVMTFTILGSTLFNLQTMIDIARELNVSILISDDLNEKVDGLFQTRFVDSREMIIDQHYTCANGSDSSLFSMRRVYELGESNQIAQDEWMYELDAKQKKGRWNKYNEACTLFFDERHKEAAELLRDYLADLSNTQQDLVATKLLENCERLCC